jgi:hypothetical protein
MNWFTRDRTPQPSPQPAERRCWIAGCTDAALARIGGLHPAIPPEAEICESHDLAYAEPGDDLARIVPLLVRPDWSDPGNVEDWLSGR